MKRTIKNLAAMAALIWSIPFVSCSDDNDGPSDPVINHIYLTVPQDKGNSIVDGSDEAVTVMVTLSRAVEANASFNFTVEGENADMFILEDNPVVIDAGKNSGFFTVKSANKLTIAENIEVTFSIAGLDDKKFDIAANTTVKLLPAAGVGDLSPEELALINVWKEKYNIDLTPWLDNVALEGTIEFPGDGYRDPFIAPETINLNGFTAFAISKGATEETPAIDMIENPMGMTDYLYKSFLGLTIEDKEFFAYEDGGSGLDLMELINWKKSEDESFAVALPGIKLTSIADGKATLEFVAEGDDFIYNSKGETIYDEVMEDDFVYSYHTSWIPFNYTYTAWDRQLGLVEEGDAAAIELLTYGVTAAPASYLGVNDVLEDYWDLDGEEDVINLYVYPKGEIDFNAGTMTFEFPFDHADQYGYSRVKVTYTLKK